MQSLIESSSGAANRRVAIAAVLVAFAVGFVAIPAAQATTAPGEHAFIPVLITNKSIAVGNEARMPRGVLATFTVKNASSRNQNFTLLGHKTGVIEPGKKRSFSVLLSRRGIYPYRSTLDNARPFRGLFIVY